MNDRIQNILQIEFKEFTLGNGLNVVMSRNPKIPNIAVNSTLHTGSKDEDEGKTGLAHLFEHLMFEGSMNIGKGKFDEILNDNGGDSNAYTSYDLTSYHMLIPSNTLEIALWLDSDRICGFKIDEESLEIQKKVVMEEKLQIHDNVPFGSLEAESSRRLFKRSGYARPIIGLMEHISKVGLDDIKDFYEKYYVPSNMVLSVVGDINYIETEKFIRKYYQDIPSGNEVTRKTFNDEELTSEVQDNISDDIHLAGKFYFYRIPEFGSSEYYAAKVINSILTDGDSSRLYNNLVYNKQLLNEIDSSVHGMEDVSLFIINAIAAEGSDLDEIQNEIDRTISELGNGAISDDEITKAKNRLSTKYVTRLQTNLNLADKFSELRTFYSECSKINSEINIYSEITKTDLVAFTEKYLRKNKRVILNYIPKNIN